MTELYRERLNRDFKSSDENDRIFEAYYRSIVNPMLDEDATADAMKTLDAIIGSLKDDKENKIYKMAVEMKSKAKDNGGFSKDQAQWIYNTSKALFKK
jgi:hypothetical protein